VLLFQGKTARESEAIAKCSSGNKGKHLYEIKERNKKEGRKEK
jgi:hypothetical protein